MSQAGGGWVTAISVDLSQWVCVRTDTHKEKAYRVEEKQSRQKRGKKEEGEKAQRRPVCGLLCDTVGTSPQLLEEIGT